MPPCALILGQTMARSFAGVIQNTLQEHIAEVN